MLDLHVNTISVTFLIGVHAGFILKAKFGEVIDSLEGANKGDIEKSTPAYSLFCHEIDNTFRTGKNGFNCTSVTEQDNFLLYVLLILKRRANCSYYFSLVINATIFCMRAYIFCFAS